MAKRVSVDRWMFTVTAILVFIGLIMVFSASAVMAKERYGSAYEFLLKQLVWAIAGLAAMFVAMRVDYRRLKHPAFVFPLVGFTTLLLISVFFLDRTHGTHRWFHLGPISFQPSELAKPALIFFLAWFLENKTNAMDDWRNTLLPAVAPTVVFLGLIVFQPDLGTALACAGITAMAIEAEVTRQTRSRSIARINGNICLRRALSTTSLTIDGARLPQTESPPGRASGPVNLTALSVLWNWNKTYLCDDLLTARANGEIDELFGQAAWVTIGVIKGGTRVRISLGVHRLDRGLHTIDRHHFDAARLGVRQTDVADAVRVLTDFRCNLLVARHLL